jgi:hypothetical protein
MSNPKRYPGGTGATYWGKLGKTNPVQYLIFNDARIPLEELPAFIAWLQEGPPKPKWRITREFNFKPDFVIQVEDATHSRLANEAWIPLADKDVEVDGVNHPEELTDLMQKLEMDLWYAQRANVCLCERNAKLERVADAARGLTPACDYESDYDPCAPSCAVCPKGSLCAALAALEATDG